MSRRGEARAARAGGGARSSRQRQPADGRGGGATRPEADATQRALGFPGVFAVFFLRSFSCGRRFAPVSGFRLNLAVGKQRGGQLHGLLLAARQAAAQQMQRGVVSCLGSSFSLLF
ncbi:hypothetical protein OsJ_29700 [Oryza sativa Japonica Group]|uniref:Uncharacterized protein n=1 Tax=Oryza sativa subsp. japonica TaxID=39947 RepID=B9G433_ORYSJ|nr:hypothetical protein OsJ_29700 [Oryza sativa Japonica Group]